MYLVTGGAGFIGSTIVKKLVEGGERVRVIDNLSTGRPEKLAGYLKDVDFREADITNFPEELFQGVHTVFHQAAIASVERSVSNPGATELNNVFGTVNVLQKALKCGVKRVVSAGSAAVYGDPFLPAGMVDGRGGEECERGSEGGRENEDLSTIAIDETCAVSPLSPYAFSKYALEYYSKMFAEMHGLETVVLRYFNVFGPFQDPGSDYSGVISKFTDVMLRDESPIIYGDGMQTRDFVFVEDVAEANLLAGSSAKVGRGEVINIGRGVGVSINELVTVINDLTEKAVKPVYGEARLGDVRYSLANIGRAKAFLGYSPRISFRDGLRRTMEWLALG